MHHSIERPSHSVLTVVYRSVDSTTAALPYQYDQAVYLAACDWRGLEAGESRLIVEFEVRLAFARLHERRVTFLIGFSIGLHRVKLFAICLI